MNGKTSDYAVGLREINYGELTPQQSNWINRHTVYTHGYGLVAAPANQVCNGVPYFVSGFLGEPAKETQGCSSPTEEIPAEQPRIYYGERMTDDDYAIVGQTGDRNVEFDRPISSGGEQYYTYSGAGGVKIGSFTRRLLYAIKEQESNFLLSEAVNSDSKLLYVRNPRDRVEKVAPFLTLDGDPYPAVVNGRVLWIIDGYTTAATYPYAERVNLQAETADELTGRGTFQLAREERQLHPQLGQGDRRRVRRHGPAVRVRRHRPGAQGVEQGVRRRPGAAQGRDSAGAVRPLPLPGGPVQSAAQPAHPVPRHRPGRLLLRAGLLAGAERAGRARQRAAAAALLPLHPVPRAGGAALPAHLRGHPEPSAEPRRADLRVVRRRAAAAGGAGAAGPDPDRRPGPGAPADDQRRRHPAAAQPALLQPGTGAVRQPAVAALRRRACSTSSRST